MIAATFAAVSSSSFAIPMLNTRRSDDLGSYAVIQYNTYTY